MMVVWRTILAINVLINVCARLVEAAPTLQTLAATGTRACLDRRSDDYRCTGRSSCEILDLSSCSFTDADICEVETCFKEASGANSIINTINIEDNDFTMSGENLIRSMLTPSGRRSASMPVCGDPTTATEIDVGHAPWEEEEDWPVDFWGPETLADRQARGQARELGSSKHAEITVGVVGKDYDMQHNLGEEDEERAESGETAVITPVWDSTDCLAHWGRPELIDSPDPDGYIIFVNGREQLGGNKYLVSDGMFIAKALGRTLVEYPVRDSRNVGFEDNPHGFGIYWDATELCMYTRILDLERFRAMTTDGRIPAENVVTLTSENENYHLLTDMRKEGDVVEYFKDHAHTQVIVMERMWKSRLERDALQYLRPNHYFAGVVRLLLQEEHEDWGAGQFVAVQWRTERSTGNLTECYEEVKVVIEQQRTALGYGRHQVFINTDLVDGTSGTYGDSKKSAGAEVLERVQRDYPAALNNRVQNFASGITDTGTKAIVAGLAAASSSVMLASSLNGRRHRDDPGAYRCQKVYSAYIHLIAQWRKQVMGTTAAGVHRLFPLGDFP